MSSRPDWTIMQKHVFKTQNSNNKKFPFFHLLMGKKKKTFDVGEITNSLYFFIPGYGLCN
jgi:hypothetical protein